MLRKTVSFIVDIPVYDISDDEQAYAVAEEILETYPDISVAGRYPRIVTDEYTDDDEYAHPANFEYWPGGDFTQVKPSDYSLPVYQRFIRDMRHAGIPCMAYTGKGYSGPAVQCSDTILPYMVYMATTQKVTLTGGMMYPC